MTNDQTRIDPSDIELPPTEPLDITALMTEIQNH